MKSPLFRAGLIGLAAASMAATAAYAESHGPMAGHHQPDPAAKAEKLRDVLQLTQAQEPALQSFIAATAKEKRDPAKMRAAHEAMKDMTTPERLDRMAAMMAEHQKTFAERAAATKRFYAALTPAQQKAFDAMAPQMMGHHKGKRGGRGGMGGRH